MHRSRNNTNANTIMDVPTKGKAAYHTADLIVEANEKSYVIMFEYLNSYVFSDYINKWIVNPVDFIRKNQKVIFVYFGLVRDEAVEALRHYYDAVVRFDEFSDYLYKELKSPSILKKLDSDLHIKEI